MSTGESIYYRRWANERGELTVEQIFPPTPDGPQRLEGADAEAIANSPDRVSVWQTYKCVKVESQPNDQPASFNISDHKLEVSGQGQSFTIEGWHDEDDGSNLTGLIEKKIGAGALTIVLERGIIQRNSRPQ
jgi:hypothetical protein